MVNKMQKFDELKLQRLIDGELDRSSVQSLLRDAEAHPELWRDMAVGFVENQIWHSEFQNQVAEKANIADVQPAETTPKNRNRIGRWLAIAAGIMLGLTVGYLPTLMNSNTQTTAEGQFEQPGQNGGSSIADRAPSLSPDAQMVSYRPDYHLKLNAPDGDSYFASEVPLFNQSKAEKMGYEMMRPINVSDELASWLQKSGYRLDQNVSFVSGKLDDGRQFVVPIRTTRMNYGQ